MSGYRASPRPTPSSTTQTTLSPRSPPESGASVEADEAGVDPGASDVESEDCDADSLADASEEAVKDRAIHLLGFDRAGRDKELSSVKRANSSLDDAVLLKKVQRGLLDRVKEATDTDWLRACPAGFEQPGDEASLPLPWSETAFNTHAVTRTMRELGIDDLDRFTADTVERGFHDLSPAGFPGLHPSQLTSDVSRLGVL